MPTRIIIAYLLIALVILIPAIAIYRARTRAQREKRAHVARADRRNAEAASRAAEAGTAP